jgi:hypothetical protein
MEIHVEIKNDNDVKEVTMRSLLKATCHELDTDSVQMRSKRRTADIAYKRHIFYYLARKHSISSLTSIGKFMNRDHTSVMHGIKKVKSLYENDDWFKSLSSKIVESAEMIDRVNTSETMDEFIRIEESKMNAEKERVRRMREKKDRHNRIISESGGRFKIEIINGKPMCVPHTARVASD